MNIANTLTMIRFALIPFIIVFLFLDNTFKILALVLFIIAGITDYFDGYFAKKRNEQTLFGNFIDPVSDKILMVGIFFTLSYLGILHIAIPLLLLGREFAMNGIRSVSSATDNIVKANIFGKTKFILQAIVIIAGIVLMVNNFSLPVNLIVNILGTIMIVFTYIGLTWFIVKNKDLLKSWL